MHQKTVLDNGLTIVTERIPEFRSCSLGLWVGAGSRFESDEQAGLSHFIEHLMFKGTTARTAYDIAVTMDGIGGQINAFTEKEHTCYYARVMDQHLPLALEVLSDMLLNSLLDPEEIEREKGVILEEIKMYEDTPDDHIYDLFTSQLYSGHSLGRPIIGRSEVVSSLRRSQLVSYMGERYLSGNLLVSAAGQVDHEAFVAMVQGKLGSLLKPGKAANSLVPPVPARPINIYNKDCEQAYLCLGGPGLRHADPRRYVMLMLDSVLGGSMSSRLFQEIREKRGLVYSVGTFQSSYFDCGIFGVYAGTGRDKVEQVLELSRAILKQVRLEGLTTAEIERAREHLKGSLALGLESTSNRMMRLARTELYHGRFVPITEVISKIEAVTAQDIHELAETLLAEQNFSLAVLGPVDEIEGVKAVPMPSGSLTSKAAHRARR